MKIKFKNNTEIEYLNALETEEHWNGSSRRTLAFECDPNVIGIDELNTILSDEENTKTLTLTGEPIPIYKTETITQTAINEAGEEITVKQTINSKDENGNNIIIGYHEVINLYDDYILKIKVGIENKLITAETPEAPAVYEDRLVFKLGKRTYIEERLHKYGLQQK